MQLGMYKVSGHVQQILFLDIKKMLLANSAVSPATGKETGKLARQISNWLGGNPDLRRIFPVRFI